MKKLNLSDLKIYKIKSISDFGETVFIIVFLQMSCTASAISVKLILKF